MFRFLLNLMTKRAGQRTGCLKGKKRSRPTRGPSFVPRLETLEDRTVPSAGYLFQTIDPPQAVNGSAATLINSSGDVVGFYIDANFVQHGYLFSHGQYTTIDDPNAGTAAGQGTLVASINASGVIGGEYIDANFVQHGYLLRHGQFTTIDDPDAATGSDQRTTTLALRAAGENAGTSLNAKPTQTGH